jgi:branched-chain amino acid transport system ATP-binding protein
MLTVSDVVVRYGAATALDGVSLAVDRGEMVALVGPNGAGKSTLVNAISGLLPLAAGSIELGGGVAQVPEGRQLFADMTVDENLRLGAWKAKSRNPSPIYELLPGLVKLRRRIAGTLSGGEQQMVAVGRALMAEPDLLVIDELSLGLAPLVIADLALHLTRLNSDHGTTILLIEQEVSLAFRLCKRSYLLEAGKIVADGLSADLAKDPAIREAYLGEFSTAAVERAGAAMGDE